MIILYFPFSAQPQPSETTPSANGNQLSQGGSKYVPPGQRGGEARKGEMMSSSRLAGKCYIICAWCVTLVRVTYQIHYQVMYSRKILTLQISLDLYFALAHMYWDY